MPNLPKTGHLENTIVWIITLENSVIKRFVFCFERMKPRAHVACKLQCVLYIEILTSYDIILPNRQKQLPTYCNGAVLAAESMYAIKWFILDKR